MHAKSESHTKINIALSPVDACISLLYNFLGISGPLGAQGSLYHIGWFILPHVKLQAAYGIGFVL